MTWNQLRCFHEQPELVAGWRILFGPALSLLTPGRRRLLLAIAALVIAFQFTFGKTWKNLERLRFAPHWLHVVVVLLLLLGFCWICYVGAKNFGRLPGFVRRHPQICLHSIFWVLLGFVWFLPLPSDAAQIVLVGCVFAFPFLVWRLGYMLFTGQRGKMGGSRFADHLFYIFPVWGGSNTPYGKGWDYLSANEAKDETELAKSQLAGLKLFLLAGLWEIARNLLEGLGFGEDSVTYRALNGLSLNVPRVGELFAQPELYPLWLSWPALYLDLLDNVLGLAIKGHIIVGCLRLFGFNVFRNTYKPLLAESVVEFWNRYYYYFKELLVNFFFYPIFARHFKGYPRIRIIVAVFMAAFVGNIYYHWLGLEKILLSANFNGMWSALQSRLLYCFLLAIGISVSMLRQQRAGTTRARGTLRRAGAIFGVWTFYSIIHIWAQKDPASLLVRVKFFLGLIGLS